MVNCEIRKYINVECEKDAGFFACVFVQNHYRIQTAFCQCPMHNYKNKKSINYSCKIVEHTILLKSQTKTIVYYIERISYKRRKTNEKRMDCNGQHGNCPQS